jgi:hypothetical protein
MTATPKRPSPEKLRELRRLVAGLCDGTLRSEDVARLEELVASDEGCCNYYVTCMHIDAALPRFAGAALQDADVLSDVYLPLKQSLDPFRVGLSDSETRNDPVEELLCRSSDWKWDKEVRLALPASSPVENRSPFRSSAGLLGVITGAIATSAVALLIHFASSSNPAATEPPVVATSFEPTLPAFKSVQLESGSVKLGIDKVGWVLVDGPTDFDLIGPMRARLNYGRIQMRVTEDSGKGFVVETPDGDITDLGTEFGIEVSRDRKHKTGLVVFEGAVDLRVANTATSDHRPVERLVGGEGVVFNRDGESARINSIVTGVASTFRCRDEDFSADAVPVILDVKDNLRPSDTKSYYEIVAGGLHEDARAYVDRPEHEWNGTSKQGLPSYLIGADYVKPFNADKIHSTIEINVTLGQPAKLYVFFDDRAQKTPDWLAKVFRKTGDKIGLDGGAWSGSKIHSKRGDGPGVSIDERFSVWELVVNEPGIVKLGPNTSNSSMTSIGMYGIAAVALDKSATPDSPIEDLK